MDREIEIINKLNESQAEDIYEIKYGSILDKQQLAKAICKAGVDRPKIVCLCGSSRFCCEIALKKWELEKQGIIAIGLHLLPANYPLAQEHHQAEFEGVAKILDELHFRKIDLADEIFVMNVGGYIGDQTRKEIDYAFDHNKPIKYQEVL